MGANYSTVFYGSNAQGVAISVGDLVIPSVSDPSSYVVATTAALAGRRPEAVALTPVGSRKGTFQLQQTGTIPAATSGYVGGESWVRCSAAGRIEACLAGDPLLVGRAEADGRVHLLMALPQFSELPVATGPGVLLFDGTTITHLPVAGKTQGDVLTLGLGLSIGWATPTGGGGSFTPASLGLSGYWPGSYSIPAGTGTLTGVASAGASGGRNLTEATNPPALGTSLNGLIPADFDGVNDRLASGLAMNNFLSTTGGSIVVLFWADTAAVDAGATVYYSNPPLVSDSVDGFLALEYSNAGLGLGTYNGGNFNSVRVAASTGSWHLAQARWDSGTAEIRVDSGSWSTLARGAIAIGSGVMRLGVNQGASKFFDGRMFHPLTSQARLTDQNFNDIKTAINTLTGLSL